MLRLPPRSLALILSALLLLPLGCGRSGSDNPDEVRRTNELNELYNLYSMFVKKNDRPPMELADLATDANARLSPTGVRALRSENQVVSWGVDTRAKDSAKVLAYEKDALAQGGLVLMADGKVRTLSADELRAALASSR